MKKTAVFPGSFDPITNGHADIIKRALPIFDKIIIAVGKNADKNYMFPLEKRIEFIEKTYDGEPKVKVDAYDGMTVDYCRQKGAEFILRGLRNPADFEFEKSIAQANRRMAPEIETVFLLTSSGFSYICSSIVRDVIRNGGDFSMMVPPVVYEQNKR